MPNIYTTLKGLALMALSMLGIEIRKIAAPDAPAHSLAARRSGSEGGAIASAAPMRLSSAAPHFGFANDVEYSGADAVTWTIWLNGKVAEAIHRAGIAIIPVSRADEWDEGFANFIAGRSSFMTTNADRNIRFMVSMTQSPVGSAEFEAAAGGLCWSFELYAVQFGFRGREASVRANIEDILLPELENVRDLMSEYEERAGAPRAHEIGIVSGGDFKPLTPDDKIIVCDAIG